jgi:hypothetical protein
MIVGDGDDAVIFFDLDTTPPVDARTLVASGTG